MGRDFFIALFRYKKYHNLREPLKIHFGGKRILFVSGRRQIEAALSSNKADLSSLPGTKIFYFPLKSDY
jgi:hypothetical protein